MANQKLTQEELQRIAQLQQQNQAIVLELGSIELAKMSVDARRENAEKALEELRSAEQQLAKDLQETYGDGTINLETGEFEPTPVEETAEETAE